MITKLLNNLRYIVKLRKTMALIFEILLILTIISPFSLAANLTPGNDIDPDHIGYVFAPFRWQADRGEANFRTNVGSGTGQQYGIIEYIESSTPNPSPTVCTVNIFKQIISTDAKYVGALLTTSHGGCGLLAVESYPKTTAGMTARDNQYNDYINNQGYTADQIYKGSGTNHYSIGIYAKFLTDYGKTAGSGNLPKSLVYIGACQSSTWAVDFVGINARVAVGNTDSPTPSQQKSRITHFFEDMNGINGITNRPVSQAMNGLSLGSNGNTATTLAPAISSFSKTGDPNCVAIGDTVTFTYETTSEQIETPGILTNKSVNVTLSNVIWGNNVTLKADVTGVTGDPVKFVVDWTKSWSDQNIARLDGNTNPAGVNAKGPAHDDYEVSLQACLCDSDEDGIKDSLWLCDNDGDGTNDNCYMCDTNSNSINDTCYLYDINEDGTNDSCEPTLVELHYFTATGYDGYVLIEWETATEIDNAGFNIWSSEEVSGEYIKINAFLIPSKGDGAYYSFTDYDVIGGNTYYYKLQDIDLYGVSTFHGPVSATLPYEGIILISPEDGAALPARHPATFEWESMDFDKYKLQFSRTADFSRKVITLPMKKRKWWRERTNKWITNNSYTPNKKEWKSVKRLGRKGRTIYWRVKGKDDHGNKAFSEIRSFTVKK